VEDIADIVCTAQPDGGQGGKKGRPKKKGKKKKY
jgi:hypothetical protein